MTEQENSKTSKGGFFKTIVAVLFGIALVGFLFRNPILYWTLLQYARTQSDDSEQVYEQIAGFGYAGRKALTMIAYDQSFSVKARMSALKAIVGSGNEVGFRSWANQDVVSDLGNRLCERLKKNSRSAGGQLDTDVELMLHLTLPERVKFKSVEEFIDSLFRESLKNRESKFLSDELVLGNAARVNEKLAELIHSPPTGARVELHEMSGPLFSLSVDQREKWIEALLDRSSELAVPEVIQLFRQLQAIGIRPDRIQVPGKLCIAAQERLKTIVKNDKRFGVGTVNWSLLNLGQYSASDGMTALAVALKKNSESPQAVKSLAKAGLSYYLENKAAETATIDSLIVQARSNGAETLPLLLLIRAHIDPQFETYKTLLTTDLKTLAGASQNNINDYYRFLVYRSTRVQDWKLRREIGLTLIQTAASADRKSSDLEVRKLMIRCGWRLALPHFQAIKPENGDNATAIRESNEVSRSIQQLATNSLIAINESTPRYEFTELLGVAKVMSSRGFKAVQIIQEHKSRWPQDARELANSLFDLKH